jgi:hypothetical protein
MDTPNARGGLLFVFREGDPPIHELDLTAAQRATVGLAPLAAPPELTHVTEEHTTDV